MTRTRALLALVTAERARLPVDAYLRELEEKTGLRPDRDVHQAFVATLPPGDGDWLALLLGRFDRTRLAQTLESRSKGKVASTQQHGTTVYRFDENDVTGWHAALAFLDDRSILLGGVAAVEKTLAVCSQGGQPLLARTGLTGLLGRVRAGSGFWMVADKEALAALHWPQAGASPPAVKLPPLPSLDSLVLSGEVDPELRLDLSAEAADEAAARNAADLARGLAGLLALQAARQPELKGLAAAFSVTSEGRQVAVTARVPYAVIEALRAHGPAGVSNSFQNEFER